MSAAAILELTDDHGDTLTVTAPDGDGHLWVRTPRGTAVHLDHDDVQALRGFLRLNLPPHADEAV